VTSTTNGTYGFSSGKEYFNEDVKEIEVWKITFEPKLHDMRFFSKKRLNKIAFDSEKMR